MARGRYIKEFERDCIRIGRYRGLSNATIARALNRTKAAIGLQVRQMETDGTLGNLPLSFVVDEIAETMRRAGEIKHGEDE